MPCLKRENETKKGGNARQYERENGRKERKQMNEGNARKKRK
jgi:hypothetical protein